ncbi:DUF2267 domain-containing protein [Oricola indica]|uniref:DUF2267 domain-containing protein n=1 Tax=Oricola indica TaxID=2872591 RepID=UPI001CBFFA5C|nr:DUF2267 domain-containing protein [Oricola indica]
MPIPQEYFTASRDFDAFMADAKEALGTVASALRRHVNGEDFERIPAGLPEEVRACWA